MQIRPTLSLINIVKQGGGSIILWGSFFFIEGTEKLIRLNGEMDVENSRRILKDTS